MMKKQMTNLVMFGVGFVAVMLGMMFIYGKKIEDPDSRVKGTESKRNIVPTEAVEKTPTLTPLSSKTDNPPPSITPDVINAKSADDYYRVGLENLDAGKYVLAIDNFSLALKLDISTPDYYIKKSEAQYKSGDKTGAIATINEGLVNIPGNNLLQDQLNILNSL